jgi:hypothetical protein
MSIRRVGMYMPDPLIRHAYDDLVRVIGDAEVGEPDELGFFEISVEATDQEDALHRIWNAVAASGADDHIFFAEHPELPEHWRPRARAVAERPD